MEIIDINHVNCINLGAPVNFSLVSIFILFMFVQYVFEMKRSRSNEKKFLESGGLLHSKERESIGSLFFLLWPLFIFLEMDIRRPVFDENVFLLFLTLFSIGQILRYLSIISLGPSWSLRDFTCGENMQEDQLGEVLCFIGCLGRGIEAYALPMMFGLSYTALIFSAFFICSIIKRAYERKRVGIKVNILC